MKGLVEAALVGLVRSPPAPLVTGDAGDGLVGKLAEPGAERAFLLRLGVAAVRARAGFVARTVERPPPAPVETRPPCSEALAGIVAELCAARNARLLGEALERLDARGLRLPPAVLPALGDLGDGSLLPAAAGACGERGRWLASHNPRWRWLVDGVAPEAPEARRRTWDEGSTEARLAVLRALRAEDPALGRTWVEEVWKAEKAGVRDEMVAAFAVGLGPADEPFLARALADRATGVRASAARLLARIDGSALAARMLARADALLAYAAPKVGVVGALKARLGGGKGAGALTVVPPPAFAEGWGADGIVEKPPAGTGEKAFWLAQILGFVRPAHWEARFGAAPDVLCAAAAAGDWADAVLGAWTDAAVLFEARAWASALWQARAGRKAPPEALGSLARRLLPLMDPPAVEAAVAPIVAGGDPAVLHHLLGAVPAPWGLTVSDAFLRALSAALLRSGLSWQDAYAWKACLETAAPAVAPAVLGRALALEAPDAADAAGGVLRNGLEAFRSVASVRHRIHEETRT